MVNHVIDTMRRASIDDVNVIVGKGAELVKEKTSSRKVTYSFPRRTIRNRSCC